ncbi:MAG: prepilin-type N-terminal cleavage/methylation domain-containing protein [Candidatus Omnitrophota bacterium]
MKKTKRGFTLIELLIVVAIIGVLAAIAVPNFINAQLRAKLARVKADFRAISSSMSMYQLDNNAYMPDGQGPCDDVISYMKLTTPVSYISSVDVFRDYFTNETATGAVGAGCVRNYYDYGMVPYITKSGLGYVVVSFGPDRDLDMGWNETSMDILKNDSFARSSFLFSPSNGLVSSGDIILTEKRIHSD